MANAQVEKLKDLSLRHGEKAMVGLAAVLCLLFLVFAVTKPTINLTPEQVNKDAEAARSNLQRRQEPADVLAALTEAGVKNPGFVKLVDAQANNALTPDSFKVARAWVSPEPGAGLIRDTPELIAATDLYAYPGRGGALVYELDENGKRIPDDSPEKKAQDEAEKNRRSRKRRRAGFEMMAGTTGQAELTDQQKKDLALKEARLKALMAGKKGNEPEKAEAAPAAEAGPFKETTKGLRWVAITGTLDHKKLRSLYEAALKDPSVAHPNYKQLDLQRQSLQSDGSWSDWEDVDAEKNRLITYNLPEEEEELTPDAVRMNALVDPLPFLKAGYWERVHVISLVPKEKREIDKGLVQGGMMPGGMMPGGGEMMAPPPMMAPGGMMPGGAEFMGGEFAGGLGGGGSENTNFQKTEEPTVMIRALDFTVEPDTTYRFRLRVVVFNPNYSREDVSPGTDTKSLELFGPWSEPTNEVTMPADVTAYAMRKSLPGKIRSDLVSFRIIRWNPEDGVTVYRDAEAGPGQIVGEPSTRRVPVSDGTGAKPKLIDFNSHQLMLDETGGEQSLTQVGIGSKLDVPAVSLLLQKDGSVMLRNEVFDLNDPVRKDMSENYDRELEESTKRRENSNGMMGPGGP